MTVFQRFTCALALLALGALGASAQTINLTNTTPFSGGGTKVKITATYTNSSPSSGTWYVLYLNKNPAVYGPSYSPGNTVTNVCDVSYNSGWTQNGNPSGWALVNDAGTGVTYPNGSGVTYNSQCIFDVGGSSYSVSGNTVTVTWSLTFTNIWANKSLAMWFYGAIGGQCEVAVPGSAPCTGWLQYGTWTPAQSTMSVVSGSPSPTSGTGSELTFTAQFNTTLPNSSWFVFDASPSGQDPTTNITKSCDVSYNSGWTGGGNPVGWSLTSDDGAGALYPDDTGTANNSQCIFDTSGSSFVVSGNTVTMSWHVFFSTAVAGQSMDLWVYGAIGGMCSYSNPACTGWQKVGTWTPALYSASNPPPQMYIPYPTGYAPAPINTFGPGYPWKPVDAIFTRTPGFEDQLTGCLYNSDGTRNFKSGVTVNWSTSWTANSGDHAHPDGAAPGGYSNTGGRPGICLKPTELTCEVYSATAQSQTDTSGCASVRVTMSWYAGEYFVTATPADPTIIGADFEFEVYLNNLGNMPQSGVSWYPDSGHPYNMFLTKRTYTDLWNANNRYYQLTQNDMSGFRGATKEGGYLDTFSPWLVVPSVKEMHEDGTRFDILAPSSARGQKNLNTALVNGGGCIVTPFTTPSGSLVFDASFCY